MDCLRVIARNLFYAALAPFKSAYNNYRDDHDQFRQLTQASGVLEVGAEQIRGASVAPGELLSATAADHWTAACAAQ
jgi:hypothetical protein